MKIGRFLFFLAATLVASWVIARRRRGPCPYSVRWVLSLPRPYIGPARLVDLLHAAEGEHLLEVGPGIGIYTIKLARAVGAAGTVEVCDIQQRFLDDTMALVSAHGFSNVRPTMGDATMLPYDDDSFDAVVLITVLGELSDQDSALGEIFRVLKPGGRLIVGESAFDPDFVSLGSITGRAEGIGFRMTARYGPQLSYLARFTKPN
jgi:ubiquinone/menaquinone biosynthesis C-methylase UbiE